MSEAYDTYLEVQYRNEVYRVKNNGSVFRYKKPGKKPRPYDCVWIFGNISKSHPYLTISKERVHQIVATAYHGNSPGPEYVVDHIDTNCRNNRPENLRWVTRLENALLNPITRKRIEYYCGSIESFLDNPSQMNDHSKNPSFNWMRTVTKEEAQACKERMQVWATTSTGQLARNSERVLGEWVFKPIHKKKLEQERPSLTKSLTPFCYQENWKVPSIFPCCPAALSDESLEKYYQNLKAEKVFSFNDKYPESLIVKKAYSLNQKSILVLCIREGIKPWALAEIHFDGQNFIHSNLGSFFSQDGAEKEFYNKQGKEWFGSDSIDEFC